MKSFTRFCFILLLLTLTILPVNAQDSSSESQVKTAYRNALDDYRTKEEAFFIASQQYYSLKTLAAQEEAVKAARDILLARTDTVLSYFAALKTTLDTQDGVELSRKDVLQKEFDLLIEELKRHRARTEIATDRLLIEEEAVVFERLQKEITHKSYRALSLIKIGAIQASLDQLKQTKIFVDEYVENQNISETQRTEKQRGSDEIGRTIERIKGSIDNSLASYDEAKENFEPEIFREIQSILSSPYGELSQSVEHLRELSQ